MNAPILIPLIDLVKPELKMYIKSIDPIQARWVQYIGVEESSRDGEHILLFKSSQNSLSFRIKAFVPGLSTDQVRIRYRALYEMFKAIRDVSLQSADPDVQDQIDMIQSKIVMANSDRERTILESIKRKLEGRS